MSISYVKIICPEVNSPVPHQWLTYMGSEQLQVPSLVFDLQRTTLVLLLLSVAIDAEFALSVEFVGNTLLSGVS